MHIESVQIQGVRNLEEIVIYADKNINIFVGKNASGKTSFLEAIHILARSKSFRTPRIKEVINHHQNELAVTANITHEFYKPLRLQVNKGGKNSVSTLNKEKIKTVSELAEILPIITITQDSQQIITGSPKTRRHWLDWAMFHVEPEYLQSWKQYFKALRQRNVLLKTGERKGEIYRPWEGEMVKLAHLMTRQRQRFLEQISIEVKKAFTEESTNHVEIEYNQGWPEEIDFEVYLQEQRAQDLKRGYTRHGPHQADIQFHTKTVGINRVFSRGQIKIYVNQLLISQARVIESTRGIKPILLIDDYGAELDRYNSEYLLYFIKNHKYQTFVTTTEWKETDNDTTMFHVEQGRLV